jgi:prepilin-type N-terminal cleavage/methylation domain-containing protein
MRRFPLSTSIRHGLTLIELLVVVSILLVLAVVALPRVRPAMEKREVREAARAINVYFGAARNRAMAIRRPVGVLIRRADTQPNAGTVLQQVEIPPPYSGDTVNTRITLQASGTQFRAELSGSYTAGSIRRGDLLQVNHQGPWYRIAGTVNSEDMDENGYVKSFPILLDVVSSGVTLPWTTNASMPLAFTVMRQPLDPFSSNPLVAHRAAMGSLTLSRNVILDLAASGTRSAPHAFSGTGGVIIVFSPTGAVGGMIASGVELPVIEPIYLLVGKWDRAGMPDSAALPASIADGWTPPMDAWPNWLDPESLWVTLNPQSGIVHVAENNYMPPPPQESNTSLDTHFLWNDPSTWGWAISTARKFAYQAQVNLGGR